MKTEDVVMLEAARNDGYENGYKSGLDATNPYSGAQALAFRDGVKSGWHTRNIGLFLRGELKEIPNDHQQPATSG